MNSSASQSAPASAADEEVAFGVEVEGAGAEDFADECACDLEIEIAR